MPKYGRPVDHGDKTRLVDIVDVPSHVDEEEWLSLMFAPNKKAWVEAGEWFRTVTQQEYEDSLPKPVQAPEAASPSLDDIKTKLAELQALVAAL